MNLMPAPVLKPNKNVVIGKFSKTPHYYYFILPILISDIRLSIRFLNRMYVFLVAINTVDIIYPK